MESTNDGENNPQTIEMAILDQYILKKFLGTFLFILVLLLGITIVIDLSEKLDDFIENQIPVFTIISHYYLNFIPWIISLIGPFFILVSVIFFTSQLAERSEIIAILNSGTSFRRFLFPYFIGATLLFIVFMFGNHFAVPAANKGKKEFEDKYINKNEGALRYSFHRVVRPGMIAYFEYYKPVDHSAQRFSIDFFDGGRLVHKLMSEKIQWDSIHQRWRVTDYYFRKHIGKNETIERGTVMDTVFPFSPDDFSFSASEKEVMTTPELTDYIQFMRAGGQPYIEFYEIEKYRRTSSSLSIFLMTLIGVSVASRKVRGGLGWHLVLGIGLSAFYEIVMKFSTTFSTNSSLPPFLGVWIPNFLFMGIALYLYRKAPK